MIRPAVTDFPEGSIQFRARHTDVVARCIVQGPAVRKMFRCSDDAFAIKLELIL